VNAVSSAIGGGALGARDQDQALRAGRDVRGRQAEPRLHVVAAERDDDEIERRVTAQARRQIVGAAAVRFDRVFEHRRSAVEPFFDHAMAVAEFPPHDAGPANLGRKPRPGRRIVAPGVGIAECDDDRHDRLPGATKRGERVYGRGDGGSTGCFRTFARLCLVLR